MDFSKQIKILYPKYKDDLNAARKKMKLFHLQNIFNPQLEDIAGELVYLFIRENKPKTILEISPCGGWSSLWICLALQDAKLDSNYVSCDLIPDSQNNLPKEFKELRTFIQADCRTSNYAFCSPIDYLFIDSEHSAPFAEWYINNLFPLVSKNGLVSIHDLTTKEGELWYKVSNEYHQQESRAVVEYCEKTNKNLWVAKHHYEEFKQSRITNIDSPLSWPFQSCSCAHCQVVHCDQDITSIGFLQM